MGHEKTVDIIIPVYRPGKEWKKQLARLLQQTVLPEHIFILQTLDKGEKPMKSRERRIQVFPVKKEEFDHGKTRAYGAGLSRADYLLFMTQDAIPADRELIARLLEGFDRKNVGIAYGRQLARKDADITEKLARLHNYPKESRFKTKADLETMGIQAFFCSDVCAMYDRKIYEELGGFSYPAIFNEDMVMAYRVLQAGYGVFYAAGAKVFHSHTYTCMQQFRRNFDLSVSQKQRREVFGQVSSEKEGAGFVKKTVITLCKHFQFAKAFYFIWQCVCRLAGYRLGKHYENLPKKLILYCTMSPGFWHAR